MALCFQQMRAKVRQRTNEVARRENQAIERKKRLSAQLYPGQDAYSKGLSEDEVQVLKQAAFGSNPEAMPTPAMDRQLKSWIELAYPQAGISSPFESPQKCVDHHNPFLCLLAVFKVSIEQWL